MLNIPFLDGALLRWFQPQTFDDPVDRLNYFYTATMLGFFALMVSAKQYVGQPIQCWIPMEFRGGWEQYAEDYCFIQNTFFVSLDDDIPADVENRRQSEIVYYQWVPMMLALQAFMFYLPNWIWKTMHTQGGIDLNTVLGEAIKMRGMSMKERAQEMGKLTSYLNEVLEIQEDNVVPRRLLCFRFGANLSNYISWLYLLVKVLYLANILLQFYIMDHFIGNGFLSWGAQTFLDLWAGTQATESSVFPRVTHCDFRIRRLANVHRYTVQCVLMINLFNEKIYLFLWCWLLFMGAVTMANVLYACTLHFVYFLRERNVLYWLKPFEKHADYKFKTLARRFHREALNPDGVLVLRFVEGHAGAIVARELALHLFRDWLNSECHRGGKYAESAATTIGGPHGTAPSPQMLVEPSTGKLYQLPEEVGLMQTDYGGGTKS